MKFSDEGLGGHMLWADKKEVSFKPNNSSNDLKIHCLPVLSWFPVINPPLIVGHINTQTVCLTEYLWLQMTLWSFVRASLIHTSLCNWFGSLFLISAPAYLHGCSLFSSWSASIFDCRPVGSLRCDKHRPRDWLLSWHMSEEYPEKMIYHCQISLQLLVSKYSINTPYMKKKP